MLSNTRGGRGRVKPRGAFRGTTQSSARGNIKRVHFDKDGGSAPVTTGPSTSRGTYVRGTARVLQRQPNRGRGALSRTFNAPPREQPSVVSHGQGSFQDRYQVLKKNREHERARAIASGFLADPDKPRTLAEAITPVGTCQDMCAEFERVERVVQNDIWNAELDPAAATKNTPDEARIVKKFRRAAAGVDEQLPSDLRPPPVLQKTLDYLMDNVVGQAANLADVHHFVWDRTRAIRNDFSIQQVTKAADLRTAITCYERIARFHIVSLHQLALPEKPYDKYDAQQEREQLDKTLLSLMQLYDDSRDRVQAPNEAEFRAYCIIFQIQDPVPDLEDRVQRWPTHIMRDARVQRALKLYTAATNIIDAQGPLKPRYPHPIAQANWRRFWLLLGSDELSYLMACIAEIYFGLIRRTALNSLWRAYRQGATRKTEDWTLDDLTEVFGLETTDEVAEFCNAYGFAVEHTADGVAYLDLNSMNQHTLPEPEAGTQRQRRTEFVEAKRRYRSLPAIIRGLSILAAQDSGMMEESLAMDEDMADNDSLFIKDVPTNQQLLPAPPAASTKPQSMPTLNPFAPTFNPPGVVDNPSSSPLSSTPAFSTTIAPTKSDAVQQAPPMFGFLGYSKPGTSVGNSASQNDDDSFVPSSSTDTSTTLLMPTISSPAESTIPDAKQLNIQPSPFAFSKPLPAGIAAPAFNFSSSSKVPSPVLTSPFSFSTLQHTSNNPFANATAPTPFNGSNAALKPTLNAEASSGATSDQQIVSQPVSSVAATTPLFTFTPSTQPSSFASSTLGAPQSQLNNTTIHTSAPTSPFPPQPLSQTTINAALPAFEFATKTPMQISSISAPTGQQALSPNLTPPVGIVSNAITRQPSAGTASSSDMSNNANTQDGHTTTRLSSTPKSLPSQEAAKESAKKASRSKETMTKLARTLVEEPFGLLEQFVEFTITPMIYAAVIQAEMERVNAEADNFRHRVLTNRYGKRWREVCWNRRLLRKGRDRRRRLAKDQEIREQRSREASISSSVDAFRETLNKSSAQDNPIRDGEVFNENARSSTHLDRSSADVAKVTSDRERSWIEANLGRASLSRGRSSGLNNSTQRQSSFGKSFTPRNSLLSSTSSSLDFSSMQRNDTTRSTYFKIKAMGLDPTSATLFPIASNENERKRTRHSDTLSPGPATKRALVTGSVEPKAKDSRHADPIPNDGNTEDNNHDKLRVALTAADEELFAELRQVREAMSESLSIFSEAAIGTPKKSSDEPQPASAAPSALTSSFRGSSSIREWVAAKLAAPHPRPTPSTMPPPSYRNRVSKFLPRERYADVLVQRQRKTTGRPRSWPRARPNAVTADRMDSASPNTVEILDYSAISKVPRGDAANSPVSISGEAPLPKARSAHNSYRFAKQVNDESDEELESWRRNDADRPHATENHVSEEQEVLQDEAQDQAHEDPHYAELEPQRNGYQTLSDTAANMFEHAEETKSSSPIAGEDSDEMHTAEDYKEYIYEIEADDDLARLRQVAARGVEADVDDYDDYTEDETEEQAPKSSGFRAGAPAPAPREKQVDANHYEDEGGANGYDDEEGSFDEDDDDDAQEGEDDDDDILEEEEQEDYDNEYDEDEEEDDDDGGRDDQRGQREWSGKGGTSVEDAIEL